MTRSHSSNQYNDEINENLILLYIDSLGFYFVAILLLIPPQDSDSPRFCAKPLAQNEYVAQGYLISGVHSLMEWKGHPTMAGRL